MSFCRERQVKACRKACDCYWCGELILVGSPKVYTTCLASGYDFGAFNTHPECHAARNEFWKKQKGYDPEEEPDDGAMKRGQPEYKD